VPSSGPASVFDRDALPDVEFVVRVVRVVKGVVVGVNDDGEEVTGEQLFMKSVAVGETFTWVIVPLYVVETTRLVDPVEMKQF